MPTIHLSFNLYWLIVPAALLALAFIAYNTRKLGSGPRDAVYYMGIVAVAVAVAVAAFILFLIGLLAYHLLTR